jgi:hypothetical protein
MNERGEEGLGNAELLRRRAERGAALPLLAMVLAAVLVMTGLVIGLTRRVADRAQAQAAADAAALAGVVDGRSGAERLAVANGATVVTFERETDGVRVVVDVDGVRAVARAERSLTTVGGGG